MAEEPTAPTKVEAHAIHLVPPSWWPLVLSLGLSAALAGIVISPFVWVGGIVVSVVALAGWLRELGNDIVHSPVGEAD